MSKIKQYINDLKNTFPQTESLEWYLINNLNTYLKNIINANTSGSVEKATILLDRFCLESMDWDKPIFKRCTELTELGYKLSKCMNE